MPIRHALWKVAEQPVPLVESALVTEGLLEDMILAAPKRKFSKHWYRQTLQKQIPQLLAKWRAKIGVAVNEVRIRRMKTRWGSCNAQAGRIWLNLELAKKSPVCLEYILVHEMVHLLERSHNERFRSLMDTVMPNWRLFREELNRAPLAHEKWKY